MIRFKRPVDRRTAATRAAVALCLTTILAAVPAAAQYRDPADAPAPPSNDSQVRKAPYRYSSSDGNFQVTWPQGCGKIRIRSNDPEYFADEDPAELMLVTNVTCDQFDTKGEGCAVTATFGAHSDDGGPAGPEQVLARVRNALEKYGVTVVRQTPVRKEFDGGLVVEGVDVQGTGPGGEGQFWVRGLLASHDIYLLTAWSASSALWDNAEFLEFFNGFLPYSE